MDPLSLTAAAASFPLNPFPITPFSVSKTRVRTFSYGRKPKFLVSASKEEDSMLNQWDLMELTFGRLLGEDPKLTLAKVMGKKLNPDATYLEIEKSFHKNKGKYDIEEIPIDWGKKGQSSDSRKGMKLVRPVPKKGFETNNKPSGSLKGLNLVRPVPKEGVKFETNKEPKWLEIKKPTQPVGQSLESVKRSVPNVILRKPSVYNEDGDETPKLRIKPNLSLRMGNEHLKEKFSDMTLLRKPQQLNVSTDKVKQKVESELVADVELKMQKEQNRRLSEILLSKRPEVIYIDTNLEEKQKSFDTTRSYEELLEPVDDSIIGLQAEFIEKESELTESSNMELVNRSDKFSIEAALQGKPQRFDQSEKSSIAEENTIGNVESDVNTELESSLTPSPLKNSEDMNWTRAEDLVKRGEREEVEMISCSTRGFVVSFGSLIGFLPYRNLAAKWKFLAFESWLRRKGLDPSTYKQSLGIIGSYDDANRSAAQDSMDNLDAAGKSSGEISPEMKLEELLRLYEQEKIKFLSSFIGQKIKVNVLMADRKSRKLIFSIRPKEKEELVEKKKSLMAKLSVGDVVKCCIRKMTYFGIFVEVEGVAALIHQTEVSWDSTLDPASYYKIGQIVEAKVHQLDFALERIFLSLKEITPDPLIEALESVVGDRNSLDGSLQAAEPDTEWAEVESLIKELQQIDGIHTVSKGRYFLSPGLAPTFQVYMASMFENQYKLLARSGNKVQEVIVQTLLDKEEMKSTILTCSSRVE